MLHLLVFVIYILCHLSFSSLSFRRLSDVLKRKRANQKRVVGPSSRKTRQDDSSNLPSTMVQDLFTKGELISFSTKSRDIVMT